MTTRILLNRGQESLIDSEDLERVSALKWIAHWLPEMKTFRAVSRDGRRFIYMHRFILGLEKGDPRIIDHINGNPLDNRKANLRIANKATNGMNRGKAACNKTGFKGVIFSQNRKRFVAQIRAFNKHRNLGTFDTPEQAHAAYCEAAAKLHGEFARFA